MTSKPSKSKTFLQKFLSIVALLVFTVLLAGIFGYANALLTGAPIESESTWGLPVVAAILVSLCWAVLRAQIKHDDKTKYNFLTTAAHQFRTPLTRIQWTLSSLSSELDTDKQRELLLSVKQMIAELVKGANQLLDATEAGGKKSLYYDYIFEEGNLSAPVNNSLQNYMPGVRDKNLTLVTDIRQGLPRVRMDRDRMEQAISILLENAIVYTPVNGVIRIKVYEDGGDVVFSITDSGIGIQKNMLGYLFTQFFRTKEAISMDANRAGLGLSLAKDIIERHGGKIYAESKGKGLGSHFWFKLPAM